MEMHIYLISQNSNTGYDTFDSAVVVAENEAAARLFHPGSEGRVWDSDRGRWVCEDDMGHDSGYKWWDAPPHENGGWCHPDNVTVEHVGTALAGLKPGVICASFNAG